MKYWLTTQWPFREGSTRIQHQNVWIRDNHLKAVDGMDKNDLVFIYETIRGRTLIQGNERIRCQRGRGGIVVLAKIKSPTTPSKRDPERYADGSVIWWRYCAPTEHVESGFIPRREVNRVLGYSLDYPFRGFGLLQSGVKQISERQFEGLKRIFNQSST